MTVLERRNSVVIDGSRRKRIAHGSGTDVQDVNRLLMQFWQIKKMLKATKGVAGKRKGKVRQRSGRLGLTGPRDGQSLR